MVIGNKKHIVEHCPDILEWARAEFKNAQEGDVFFAPSTDILHGRYNKTFRWSPGQLVFAVIIKNDQMNHKNFSGQTPPMAALHMMFELGILKPFLPHGAGFNWPDDVVIQHKRVASIFTEAVVENGRPAGIIAVIIANINNTYSFSSESYHTATNLKDVTKRVEDIETYFAKLLESIEEYYQMWTAKQYPALYDAWKAKQLYLDDTITFYQNIGMVMRGIVKDFLPNGDMVLHDERGKTHTLNYVQIQDNGARKS